MNNVTVRLSLRGGEPMPDFTRLFDAAVELLVPDPEDPRRAVGFNADEHGSMPAIVLFGTIIPTQCEHTHVEDSTGAMQPWN